MGFKTLIGNPLDGHIVNQLDRILERQRDTQRAVSETQRTVERIEIRASMVTNTPPKKRQWNIQLMVYLFIIALTLGGHITIDQAKEILTVSQR